ncbi:unnamed protein product [Phaedon cochleariae]|uniref:Uncharacterized protein n=1 Tax=Phaedon cochleariae TaxID=80249 RepID=A0A9N9SIE2_PHACE|nr:unnamed protein product [Phaedon cochleariae]
MNSQELLDGSGVSFMAQQFQLLNSQLATLSAGMNDIRALLAEQNEKIDGCMAHIVNLREENESLKVRVTDLEKKMDATSAPTIYSEVTSRLEREKNVIINGIDESVDDTKAVSNILLELNLPKPLHPTRMYRLGKQDLSKIRPLKVEFSSRQEALSILTRRPKLPLKEFPNVKIKNDYTPRLREELTSMYKEIEQRRAHGENLRVKFVSKQPTIVSATPKRPRDE